LSQHWRRPVDRILRRARPSEIAPITVHVTPRRLPLLYSRAPTFLLASLVFIIALGGALLLIPFANTQGIITPPLIAYFTAISAVTTTGLTLEPTATYWTFFGQVVIWVLMFVGGTGFMTIASFFLIALGRRLSLSHLLLMRESLLTGELGGLKNLTRNVFLMGLVVSFFGTWLLFWPFLRYFSPAKALWQAAFHSVSAFATAGFDIVGPASFVDYRADYFMLGMLIIIFVIGALSYPVIIDTILRRKFRGFSLNTKLVLVGSLIAWALGTLTMFASEYGRQDTLGNVPLGGQIFIAFFNALSGSTTTGFATLDFGRIHERTHLLIDPLMFIGGAAASTAGGIKINNFIVLLVLVYSWTHGRSHPEAFKREVEPQQVLTAITVVMVSLLPLFATTLMLSFTDSSIPFLKLLFENISAFATVGLSTGVLPDMSVSGKLVIMFMMFVGRLGSLTLILALVPSARPEMYYYQKERMVIG
jgi:trk system potassium uptake protein TrkH